MNMSSLWTPYDPAAAMGSPSTGPSPGRPGLRGCLGAQVSCLGDLEGLRSLNLKGRTVVLTLGSEGAAEGAPSFLRAALYSLCDAVVRPFCAATHRPFPLQELARREASAPQALPPKRMSSALFDAGHIMLGRASEGAQGPRSGTPCDAPSVIEALLGAAPASLFVIGDAPEDASLVYGLHAALAEAEMLPLVSLCPRLDMTQQGSGALGDFVRHNSRSLAGGEAWLALGLLRGVNAQEDYDVALQSGLAAVEYLHLLGVWRNAVTGREVSPLEHLHDHCDRATSLQWRKERMGLHVTFDLDVLGDVPEASSAVGWQPFGCRLQDLGGVLTFLGRTGLCRVLHLISADRSAAAASARAHLMAHLIYKLVLLREEYSES